MKEILIIATITKIIVDLHKIFGKEKFINGLLIISKSKELFYIYRTIIILTLAVSLLLGFIAGVLNILKGKILIGFVAFSLITTASILLAFFNWQLSKRKK
jgi:hypothetical protein